VIVDTSALVAIFFAEPEARFFSQLITDAEYCGFSVVSRVELAIVLERQG
jgi:ribonuclease VapC